MKNTQQTRSRGQIIEKGPEKFLIRVYLGTDADGKRQYANETIDGPRSGAEKALTAKLHDLDTGRLVISPRMTVEEFLKLWLESIASSIEPRTVLFYEQYAKKVNEVLGRVKVGSLQPAQVQHAYAKLAQSGQGPRSIRHANATLRGALRWGRYMRMLGTCATDGVKLPKIVKNTEKMALTPTEAKQLLASSHSGGDSLYALWRVLLESGIRPQEARALTWDDLVDIIVEGRHYKALRVTRAVQVVSQAPRREEVRSTKTDRSRRTIPLTSAAIEALTEHRKAQNARILTLGSEYQRHGYIFAGRFGELLSAEGLLGRWHKALATASLPKIRAYAARHTAATLLLEAGVPLKVVSELLGHSTIAQTADTYSHVTAAMAVAATAAMEGTLSRPSVVNM